MNGVEVYDESHRNGPFKGRTVAVVNDLSLDEQRYLYRKAGELKRAVRPGGDAREFRLNDNDYSVYLIFMEDSTRTSESFRNAAKFLGARTNLFDTATSSFNKNESMSDAIKMLYGYSDESCFVIRSKLEGVCRWLEDALGRYADPIGQAAARLPQRRRRQARAPHPGVPRRVLLPRAAGRPRRAHPHRPHRATSTTAAPSTPRPTACGSSARSRSTSSRPRSSACPTHYVQRMRDNGFRVQRLRVPRRVPRLGEGRAHLVLHAAPARAHGRGGPREGAAPCARR